MRLLGWGAAALLAACQGSIAGSPGGVLEGPTFGPQRSSWVVSEVLRQNQTLSEELRREKFAALSVSAYNFYRGTNHLFWADFAQHPKLSLYGNEDTRAWLQGDLHTNNLGAFANDQGRVVYDLNDFDEAVLSDYQLDLWRMATSIVLLAQEKNLSTRQTKDALDAFSESYLDAMADFHGTNQETDLQLRADNAFGPLDEFLQDTEQSDSRKDLLSKWTNQEEGVRAFDLSQENLAPLDPETRAQIELALPDYGDTLSGDIAFEESFFLVKDAARRLHAGVGSLGQARFYVLIEGPTGDPDDDILLDIKRQPRPSAYELLPKEEQALLDSLFLSDAERSILAQRALGYHVDDLSGFFSLPDGDYTIRELSPFKESLPSSSIEGAGDLREMGQQWGVIIAAAHARADEDFNPLFIAGSVDKAIDLATDGDHSGFRSLVREVALSYAAQVKEDYQAFVTAGLF